MKTLHVVEGEKCADCLAELGLVVTTSQGGCVRAKETDWTPAARFERVLIWKDVDADAPGGGNPGEKFASTVCELIAAAAGENEIPCPVIVVVDLRGVGLADGDDVFDYVEQLRTDGKDNAEICSGLDAVAVAYGQRWAQRVDISYPGQPAPLVQKAERPTLANFKWIEKAVISDGAEEKTRRVPVAEDIHSIRASVVGGTGGWPCRVKSPGARLPLLFVDEGGADPRWLAGTEPFTAWLHENVEMKFLPKLDANNSNFVKVGDVYNSFGGHGSVNEFLTVESRPHEPLMKEHYYMFRPPAGYQADGKRLIGMLRHFDNAKGPEARALIAAAFLSPGWGGPYGQRPAIVITAPDRGCGKTTLAKAIGRVWSGWVSVDLGQRAEEVLKERLLSPDALMKRVVLIDNVKGVLSNPMIEAMITEEWINGKRLYTGDARRPNTLLWIVTANGVRLSRDMAQRSFFIELTKPAYRADWERSINEYLTLYQEEIVCDCIAVLRSIQGQSDMDLGGRQSLWAENVLAPVCRFPALAEWINEGNATPAAAVTLARSVMADTQRMRDDADEDRQEAEMLLRGLCEHIVIDATLEGGPFVYEQDSEPITYPGARTPKGKWKVFKEPKADVFIPSDSMLTYWTEIFGKKLNAKSLKQILREHRESGRLVGVDEGRTRAANGYSVHAKVLCAYMKELRETMQAKSAELVTAGEIVEVQS